MTWGLWRTKVIASLDLRGDVSAVLITRMERPTATMAGAFPRFAGWGRRSRDCIGMKLSVPRARWYRLAAMPIEFPRPGRCTRSSPAPVERRGPGGGVGEVAGTRRRSGEIRNSHVVEAEVSEETAQPSGPLRGEMSSLPQFADNNWYVN